jgi:hypothetical protein
MCDAQKACTTPISPAGYIRAAAHDLTKHYLGPR